MFAIRSAIRFWRGGFRPLISGTVFGFVALGASAAVLMPVLVAPPVSAAVKSPNQNCFSAVECHEDMAGQPLCGKSGGCCVGDRCFVPGDGCTSTSPEAVMGRCYAKSPPVSLTVGFGGVNQVVDIGEYLNLAYKYGLGIAAFLAAIMMIVGGFMYLTAGDSGRSSQGKEYIVNAVYGLAVAIGAYVLLATVNPDLLKMSLPKVPIVKRETFIGCTLTQHCHPCGESYDVWVAEDGSPPSGDDLCPWTVPSGSKNKPSQGKYFGAECVGNNCYMAAKENGLSGMSLEECRFTSSRCRLPIAGGADTGGRCGLVTGNETGYVCAVCVPDGGPCTPDGKNELCCGGFCGNGKCSPGQPGDQCNDNKECVSGICQSTLFNSCSTGQAVSPCDDRKECAPGLFCQTTGNNTCSPGTKYSWCSLQEEITGGDRECASGLTCLGYVCSDTPSLTPCVPGTEQSSCPSGAPYCSTGLNSVPGAAGLFFCSDGSAGSPCGEDGECAPVSVGWGSGTAQICVKTIHTCGTGENGTICENGYDCRSGFCGQTPKGGVCVSGSVGSRCGAGESPHGSGKCATGLVCRKGAAGYDRCDYP
ncbi:hypothetical protein JW899_01380 [Candidatus Uhrbacteria bacterium]|nr:hypothetical protein [Candidatus Uhrbacteria bacterium]